MSWNELFTNTPSMSETKVCHRCSASLKRTFRWSRLISTWKRKFEIQRNECDRWWKIMSVGCPKSDKTTENCKVRCLQLNRGYVAWRATSTSNHDWRSWTHTSPNLNSLNFHRRWFLAILKMNQMKIGQVKPDFKRSSKVRIGQWPKRSVMSMRSDLNKLTAQAQSSWKWWSCELGIRRVWHHSVHSTQST